MAQLMDIEQYIRLVRNVGIEAAYAERFRQTGRTVRDVLNICTAISEGRKLYLISGLNGGYKEEHLREILSRVDAVCNILGMRTISSEKRVEYSASGGSVTIGPKAVLGEEIYQLHDLV